MSHGLFVPDRPGMEVFLIPIGPDQYEPYCEGGDELEHPGTPASPRGWWGRLHDSFRQMLSAAERERVRTAEEREAQRRTWVGRLRGRTLRWIAEKIAEQRLLWHLRRQDQACLVHPADVSSEEALGTLRKALQRDGERHRRWLVIDGLLLVVSGLLALVPGPNVLAYYFGFRVFGHYLSWRGAQHGFDRVQWTMRASRELADLRQVTTLAPGDRERHVSDIASRLQLEHLPRFFARMAAWSA